MSIVFCIIYQQIQGMQIMILFFYYHLSQQKLRLRILLYIIANDNIDVHTPLNFSLMVMLIWLDVTYFSSSFYMSQLDHPLERNRRTFFVKKNYANHSFSVHMHHQCLKHTIRLFENKI